MVEASTSTVNGRSGSGCCSRGAVLKASLSFSKVSWAEGFHARVLGLLRRREVKWSSDATVVKYKLPVEVSKAEESLELFNSARFLPLTDGLDFPLVHLDSRLRNDVTQQ